MKSDLKLLIHNRMALIFIDICIVAFSAFFSLIMRFDITSMPTEYWDNMVRCLPVDMVITVVVFWFMRLYHSLWSFVSTTELARVFASAVIITVLEIIYKQMGMWDMPRSYYFINFVLLFMLAGGARISVRGIRKYRKMYEQRKNAKRTMVVGAGNAASILIKEYQEQEYSHSKVVCIIDDNPNKIGSFMHGVKVVGSRNDISEAVDTYKVEEIIIALPSAGADVIREISNICSKTGARVLILPSVTTTLEGGLSKSLREITFHDLTGREPAKVDREKIDEFLKNKVVLITGGGGSIGSELCRQVAAAGPKILIIFDCYENNAYSIQLELRRTYPTLKIITLIGSVRDYDRLTCVFEKYRPNIVYHAAAHKHVPLMEDSPNEAVKNNCMGTWNTATLADKYGVESFVMISTDKAVRPTNIMGATKRVCELIIQMYARTSKTNFVAVRFGNVFGSNGSVIPLFYKQIDNGGPVTVTHKDITRFFMSIPEAVSLVLQAGVFAKGGEIFVLNMGQPVRIYDLAENLIRLKGYRPGVDIKIEITGLRPGEKLYEEMLMEEEGLRKTPNDMIFIGEPIDVDRETFMSGLNALITAAQNNAPNIKEQMTAVCDTYSPTDN